MKISKKLVSVLLVLTMLVALSVSVLADDTTSTYTITIDKATSGHTYNAYKVFSGDLSGNVLSTITWGDDVNSSALLAALQDDAKFIVSGTNIFASASDAAGVAKALTGQKDNSDIMKEFAQVVGKNLSATATPAVSGNYDADKKEYTITGLTAGYYFVKDANAVTGDDASTRYILNVVKDITVEPKSSVPTVEKKVQENSTKYTTDAGYGAGYNDVADYNIGDTVPFELIGTLPTNYADYTTYNYVFTDTLSAGLSVPSTFTFTATAKTGDTVTDVTTSFTSTVTAKTDGTTSIAFACANLKTIQGLTAASTITIKYSATLNSGAVIGLPGNPNEVYLTFSNNPNKGGEGEKGTTPTDKVIVFTYELDTTKVDGSDTTKTLAKAEFELYKTVDGTNNYAVVTDGKLTGWTTDEAKATKLTSDANGLFKVAGLDDGTYYLKETKAPAGYNLLAAPVKLAITATTANGQNWTGTAADALTALSIKVGNSDAVTGDTAKGTVAATIENNAGSTLPSTGGIGTTLFYVIGILLMSGAAVLLVTKKKMANREN